MVVLASCKQKLVHEIAGVLRDRYLSGDRAASLCGEPQSTLIWAFGKFGRACRHAAHLPLRSHTWGVSCVGKSERRWSILGTSYPLVECLTSAPV